MWSGEVRKRDVLTRSWRRLLDFDLPLFLKRILLLSAEHCGTNVPMHGVEVLVQVLLWRVAVRRWHDVLRECEAGVLAEFVHLASELLAVDGLHTCQSRVIVVTRARQFLLSIQVEVCMLDSHGILN